MRELAHCELCGRLFPADGHEQCPPCRKALAPREDKPVDMAFISDGTEPKKCPRCGQLYYSYRTLCPDCIAAENDPTVHRCEECGKYFRREIRRGPRRRFCAECAKERLRRSACRSAAKWAAAHREQIRERQRARYWAKKNILQRRKPGSPE